MDVKGRVALVTGGASDIGKAYAVELLNQGAKVSICDMDESAGEDLVDTFTSEYGKDRVVFCLCDVTDSSQLQDSFVKTVAAFGHIDIVINFAGIMADRFWELEVDTNLNAVIRGTMLAYQYLGTDNGGRGGVVVNTGSSASFDPYISMPVYSATKAAIVSLTRAFGDQYHVDRTGVRVMAVCPSATDSDLEKIPGKQFLSARYEDAWRKETTSTVSQKVEHVAKALTHVLSVGKSGTVWHVEHGQPPREVIFPKY